MYRDDFNSAYKEARWTFWRVFPFVIVALATFSALAFVLHSAGYIGSTIVERKVFENSYQRSEAKKSALAQDKATLAEINRNLNNPNLDSDTRHALEAQAAAARIRIRTLEENR